MAEARAEPALQMITGFRTVFDREEFHKEHESFLDWCKEERHREEDLEETIAQLERKMQAGTLDPAYIYNDVVQREKLEGIFGVWLKAAEISMYVGAGIVLGLGAARIIPEYQNVQAALILAGGIGGLAYGIESTNRKPNTHATANALLEKLRDDYGVGTRDQAYPPRQSEVYMQNWWIFYEREGELNPLSQAPARSRELHRLGKDTEEPMMTVVVENGVPKRVLMGKDTYEVPPKGEAVAFKNAFALPTEVANSYRERLSRYIAFV